jgi:hypothetical protein
VEKAASSCTLVGISNYRDPALCLLYASKDAVDMSMELFRQKGGLYRDVNIRCSPTALPQENRL